MEQTNKKQLEMEQQQNNQKLNILQSIVYIMAGFLDMSELIKFCNKKYQNKMKIFWKKSIFVFKLLIKNLNIKRLIF